MNLALSLTNLGKQIGYSADVIEDFARTDTAIAGLDPWRTEIPLKDFASRVRFQVSNINIHFEIKFFKEQGPRNGFQFMGSKFLNI